MKQQKLIAGNRRASRAARTTKKAAIFLVAAVMLTVAAVQLPQSTIPVAAVDYSARIKQLQKEADDYSVRAKELSEQSDSLSTTIATLQNQQDQIQAEIDLNNAKVNELNKQIADNEAKIKKQGGALSSTMADMYFDQQVSPLEMLASSSNLSDYVDKQSRQAAVQDQLKASIRQINDLKRQLQTQKTEVEALLRDQQTRRNDFISKKQEQQNLLDKTQGQEEIYKNLTNDKKKEKERLEEEQRRINSSVGIGSGLVLGDPNHGGYPAYLDNARKDSLIDPWGMYNRECVSYTAWKVHQAYGNMPYWGGKGNANQWVGNARAAGIPTGSTPKAGSVGAFGGGSYGHVVWVERVSDDNTKVYISQYNTGSNGQYSEQWISASTYTYIYFGEWNR